MIHLQNVQFRYPGQRETLFKGLDLRLGAGTLCGMLGPNGAGKSTLLKLLSGLVFPQAGSCTVLGREPARRHPSLLADIFVLPEDVFAPALSASAYRRRYASFYPRFDHAVFEQLLQEFDLPSRKRLDTFSHGGKKKFLLAFGIATNTRLLILDEPTNGLDIPGKAQFRRVLVNHFQDDRSFLISTHQVHDLEGLIDSIVIIADGRILLNQPLDAVSNRLSVSMEYKRPDAALYFEEGLEGYKVLRKRVDELETRIDLSLLFGLVTGQPDLVPRIFPEDAQ